MLRCTGFCLLACLPFFAPRGEEIKGYTQKIIRHKVLLIHPGISLRDPVEMTLVEKQIGQQPLSHFYMDVASVVCGDEHCRIDSVRIHWNELGEFEYLELPSGVALEKEEGRLFSAEDYKRLDTILHDSRSPLRDVYKWEIVGAQASEGVDAITSATIALDKQSYVAGAVWTCYTLWHWANGEVVSIIRRISGKNKGIEELENNLKMDHVPRQLFALEEISRRNNYKAATTQTILTAMKCSPALREPGLDYLSRASSQVFQLALNKLLETTDATFRLECLQAILTSRHVLPQCFFEELSIRFADTESYQEIQLFLRILQERHVSSPLIQQRLLPLLDRGDFLIARAIYWYLADKEVAETTLARLEQFYTKHKDEL